MRRLAILALTALFAGTLAIPDSYAQSRRRGNDPDQEQKDAARKKKRDEEFDPILAPLPQLRNAGPCPYVKVLYDASRYVEFASDKETASSAGFVGEIQNISAGCEYKDAQPIHVVMRVLFSLGRGPSATADRKVYRYWVAVTDRNQSVIAKEYFDLPVIFPSGQDRVTVTEDLQGVTIPRADVKTSGANFEVLIGFDVTPKMASFNRDGKRFRLTAGQGQPAASPPAQ